MRLTDAAQVPQPDAPKSDVSKQRVSLDNLDSVQLPTRLPRIALPDLDDDRPVGALDGSGQLDDLVDLSLTEARKLIETEWGDCDRQTASAKTSLIQTVFNIQTKVDDTRLRRRQVDMLPKLLELIAREEQVIEG